MTEKTGPATTATDAGPHSTEEVLRRLEDAVAADRPRRDLRLTDSINRDIGLDSLALLEVLTRVEEEFGIELLDTPETYTAATVQDLVELIQRKVADSGGAERAGGTAADA